MSKTTKVLIVDDSAVYRGVLSKLLTADASIMVSAVASNGREALDKVKVDMPDIVLLDLEMPVMGGIETLKHLRKSYPKLPVIIVSALTVRGASSTLEALAAGASDYVPKAGSSGEVRMSVGDIGRELLQKIHALTEVKVRRETAETRIQTPQFAPSSRKPDMIVIGSSTGGPRVLESILSGLPADFAVPISIVQHMPPVFTRQLANKIDKNCRLSVVEAEAGMEIVAGGVYIAPGDFHMTVERDKTRLVVGINQDEKVNYCRPAVDVLYYSAAKVIGRKLLAVQLTGMGHDGRDGCKAIRQGGGDVIAQDEKTSTVWGMPGSVVEAGLASMVLTPDQIVGELTQRVRGSAVNRDSINKAG
jgi:two-component system, chemotaxis family, protein-glutamate methylesterase/glutaminase